MFSKSSKITLTQYEMLPLINFMGLISVHDISILMCKSNLIVCSSMCVVPSQSLEFVPRHEKTCFFAYVKTKAQIRSAPLFSLYRYVVKSKRLIKKLEKMSVHAVILLRLGSNLP